MNRPHPQQLGLFAQVAEPVRWNQADRQKAMTLLQHLLTEAMSTPCAPQELSSAREADDEQDHG